MEVSYVRTTYNHALNSEYRLQSCGHAKLTTLYENTNMSISQRVA